VKAKAGRGSAALLRQNATGGLASVGEISDRKESGKRHEPRLLTRIAKSSLHTNTALRHEPRVTKCWES